jgi:hypothetical protein
MKLLKARYIRELEDLGILGCNPCELISLMGHLQTFRIHRLWSPLPPTTDMGVANRKTLDRPEFSGFVIRRRVGAGPLAHSRHPSPQGERE